MIDDSHIWLPLQKKLSRMSIIQRQEWAAKLTKEEQHIVIQYPEVFLGDYQFPPTGDWFYYWARFGRGLGKTLMMILLALQKSRQGAEEIDYFAPTHNDLKKEVYPIFLRYLNQPIVRSDFTSGIVETKNSLFKFYTSETEPRGMNADYMFWDEIPKWCGGTPSSNDQISYITSLAKLGLRGKKASPHPQLIIGSTPKPFDIFIEFEEKALSNNPRYAMRIVSTRDAVFLPAPAKEAILEEFKGHPLERQEIDADIIRETPGSYWTHAQLSDARKPLPAPLTLGPKKNQLPTNDQLMGRAPMPVYDPKAVYLLRVVIGLDPAGSVEGDETGIVIVALFSDKTAFVLEDCSGHYTPDQYSQVVSDKYKQYPVSAVVVESNFGGKETFLYVLRSKNAAMNVLPRHNSQGKTTRAEHISALYAQKRVFHSATFKQLEDQMCSFNVNYSKSPDRLDALGLAITELFWPTDARGQRVSILNLPAYG